MQRHVQVHVHVHVYMYEHKQNMHGTCTQIHKTECCLYNKRFPPPRFKSPRSVQPQFIACFPEQQEISASLVSIEPPPYSSLLG